MPKSKRYPHIIILPQKNWIINKKIYESQTSIMTISKVMGKPPTEVFSAIYGLNPLKLTDLFTLLNMDITKSSTIYKGI
jgi:hypothetical protein